MVRRANWRVNTGGRGGWQQRGQSKCYILLVSARNDWEEPESGDVGTEKKARFQRY